jgi:hypothetical protein
MGKNIMSKPFLLLGLVLCSAAAVALTIAEPPAVGGAPRERRAPPNSNGDDADDKLKEALVRSSDAPPLAMPTRCAARLSLAGKLTYPQVSGHFAAGHRLLKGGGCFRQVGDLPRIGTAKPLRHTFKSSVPNILKLLPSQPFIDKLKFVGTGQCPSTSSAQNTCPEVRESVRASPTPAARWSTA